MPTQSARLPPPLAEDRAFAMVISVLRPVLRGRPRWFWAGATSTPHQRIARHAEMAGIRRRIPAPTGLPQPPPPASGPRVGGALDSSRPLRNVPGGKHGLRTVHDA